MNVSHSSNGKWLYINSHHGAKTRGNFASLLIFWPIIPAPEDLGYYMWDSPLYLDMSSLSWIPLLGTLRLVRKKKTVWKIFGFAHRWKFDTINENENWTLWVWIGIKYGTKRMFVISFLLIKCFWRDVFNVHYSILSLSLSHINSLSSYTSFCLFKKREERD